MTLSRLAQVIARATRNVITGVPGDGARRGGKTQFRYCSQKFHFHFLHIVFLSQLQLQLRLQPACRVFIPLAGSFSMTWRVFLFCFLNGEKKGCFTATETIGTVRDGEPSTATPTFTQLVNYVREREREVNIVLNVHRNHKTY